MNMDLDGYGTDRSKRHAMIAGMEVCLMMIGTLLHCILSLLSVEIEFR